PSSRAAARAHDQPPAPDPLAAAAARRSGLARMQAADRAHDQAAANAPLDDPAAVARLLDRLQAAQAAVPTLLAGDQAPRAAVADPAAVATRLDCLQAEQAAALASRATSHARLDNPDGVTSLLASLRAAGAHEQAAALVSRLPAAGMFGLFLLQE